MHHNLTIAICTHNRAHILPEALTSLLQQTVHPEDYSILIIDNNSTDHTQDLENVRHTSCYTSFLQRIQPKQGKVAP